MDSSDRLVIPPDNLLKKQIMHVYHNGLSGHPEQDKMMRKILEGFY
jgi:hypothetical protein